MTCSVRNITRQRLDELAEAVAWLMRRRAEALMRMSQEQREDLGSHAAQAEPSMRASAQGGPSTAAARAG
jgi:hypothetical protein